MRRLISALFSSLPKLGNVVVFLLFIFILFGILGVQQFSGSMYKRCRYDPDAIIEADIWPIDYSYDYLCSNPADLGLKSCPATRTCASPDMGGVSLTHENISDSELIFYGYTSFDNIGSAIFTLF